MRNNLLTHLTRKLLLAVCLALLAAALIIPAARVIAQDTTPTPPQNVQIYMFWGDTCPVCAKAKPFLENLSTKYPQIELKLYEIYSNVPNRQIFADMGAKFGFEPKSVPTIFIGTQYLVGYNDDIAAKIEGLVKDCLANGCPDAGSGVITPASQTTPEPRVTPVDPQASSIKIPLIGEVNLAEQSLFVSTLLISFVDGFNPCSVWVLSMLLALTIHTGSRKKVIYIGLIFLTVTALIYALFIAGLFSVLKVISFVGWIQLIVALVAAFFGAVNIKDYFWYKEGLSFTISDEKRPGILKRLRNVMDASQSFWGLTGATIVLAAGVSLVEFSCTAGFPVLWTNLLNAQGVAAGAFLLLLAVYMLIYQADELVIFFGAVISLRASKLQEKQGRILKLIGGVLMLTLALVMLINPELMSNLGNSLLIFGAAFAAAALILVLHRIVLPKFGVWIGTEQRGSSRGRLQGRPGRATDRSRARRRH